MPENEEPAFAIKSKTVTPGVGRVSCKSLSSFNRGRERFDIIRCLILSKNQYLDRLCLIPMKNFPQKYIPYEHIVGQEMEVSGRQAAAKVCVYNGEFLEGRNDLGVRKKSRVDVEAAEEDSYQNNGPVIGGY